MPTMTAQVSHAVGGVPFRYERVGPTGSGHRGNVGGRPRSNTSLVNKKATLPPAPVYTANRYASVQSRQYQQAYPTTPYTASVALGSAIPSPAPGTTRRHHIPPLSAAGLPASAATPSTAYSFATPSTAQQVYFQAQPTSVAQPLYTVLHDAAGNQYLSSATRSYQPSVAYQQPTQTYTITHNPQASRRRPSLGSPYVNEHVSPPSSLHQSMPASTRRPATHRPTLSSAHPRGIQPAHSSSERRSADMVLPNASRTIVEESTPPSSQPTTHSNHKTFRKRSLAQLERSETDLGSSELRKSQRRESAQTSAVNLRNSAQSTRTAEVQERLPYVSKQSLPLIRYDG